MLYSLHIFTSNGECIFRQLWNENQDQKKTQSEYERLLFGMLFSLRRFNTKMSPKSMDELESEAMYTLTTKGYRLHYFETLTRTRFVLMTDPLVQSQRQVLQRVYDLYTENVLKNPTYKVGSPIELPNFVEKLRGYFVNLPYFAS